MSTKNRNKATKRNASKVTPRDHAAKLPKVSASIHALIVEDCESMLDEGMASVSNYIAFAEVLRAIKWADADHVKAVCEDVKETFGDMHFANACKRVNIINNARKVACGGKHGEKVVSGKGIPTMLAVIETCYGIDALKKAMADAKPAALKDSRGGKRTDPNAPKAPDVTVNKLKDAKSAYEAACNVLGFVEKFLKPSDGKLLRAIDSIVSELQERIAA